MRKSYLEGRCKHCGSRVSLERGTRYHRGADGRPCGPVETHRPGSVSDHAAGHWVAPKRHERGA